MYSPMSTLTHIDTLHTHNSLCKRCTKDNNFIYHNKCKTIKEKKQKKNVCRGGRRTVSDEHVTFLMRQLPSFLQVSAKYICE